MSTSCICGCSRLSVSRSDPSESSSPSLTITRRSPYRSLISSRDLADSGCFRGTATHSSYLPSSVKSASSSIRRELNTPTIKSNRVPSEATTESIRSRSSL